MLAKFFPFANAPLFASELRSQAEQNLNFETFLFAQRDENEPIGDER